jgi:hypothetical protein
MRQFFTFYIFLLLLLNNHESYAQNDWILFKTKYKSLENILITDISVTKVKYRKPLQLLSGVTYIANTFEIDSLCHNEKVFYYDDLILLKNDSGITRKPIKWLKRFNTIKFDFPALFRNTLSISYERNIAPSVSLEAGIGNFFTSGESNYTNSGVFFRGGIKYTYMDFPRYSVFTGTYLRADLIYLNQQIITTGDPKYVGYTTMNGNSYSIYATQKNNMIFNATALIMNLGVERVFNNFLLIDVFAGAGFRITKNYTMQITSDTTYEQTQSGSISNFNFNLDLNPNPSHIDTHGIAFDKFDKPTIALQMGIKVGFLF